MTLMRSEGPQCPKNSPKDRGTDCAGLTIRWSKNESPLMHQLFVYADSLSWGIIPTTRERLGFDHRWPGVLEAELLKHGRSVRVLEDCLNGRRTVFEDSFLPGRNGLVGLAQKIEMNSPLAVVIVMLGTNDFQSVHPHTAWHAAQGMATLVRAIRQAPIEPGMPTPPTLVVVPPPIEVPRGPIAAKFAGAAEKCVGLAQAYREVCSALNCHYFDAGTVTSSSRVDGAHLDADQHAVLGRALASVVAEIIPTA
jgi:lysophospholipase L1-like esterase